MASPTNTPDTKEGQQKPANVLPDTDYEEIIDEDDEEFKEYIRRKNIQNLNNRRKTEPIPLRVHDIFIKGNTKTKDSVIEVELDILKSASTMQDLIIATRKVQTALARLEIFDSVNVTFDVGPIELPGTTNVVVEVVEAKPPWILNVTPFEDRRWSTGAIKYRNLFGYGDLWDGSLAHLWDQYSEMSAGVSLPRFKGLKMPVSARVSLLCQDWLKFASYKEQILGLSLGLFSSGNHDLSYSLAWRTLTDPSQMSSRTARRQLGHSLVSALKHTYRIDTRNSIRRPTSGYAFTSTSQIGGLMPDYRSSRFFRQEFDFRYALPLGLCNAALNFGVSAGVVFPWGSRSSNMDSYLPQRFFLGGNSSNICSVGGPTSLLGFKPRGVGPAEPRRIIRENATSENSNSTPKMEFVGGDLSLTASADLSFDLPIERLRKAGIYGHAFACTGSLNKLTENAYRDLSFQKFRESFRSSVGIGIIIPITKFFRMEVNYCHLLNKQGFDRGKSGLQFSFSPY